ncbi:MAG: hypothetical protein RDU24_13120 [Humidesulfovibrio sp.]|uniref:hypothetical protein n=1 Tax=Humidesulfovibrio sp. TaxID=2910988 RepID=UPI0027FFDA57|nr:hypothetical protein [Humidesulfovibrio sp.]MDQ7836317.1 hypothetical protein [Humidesulfovibrio sp.]
MSMMKASTGKTSTKTAPKAKVPAKATTMAVAKVPAKTVAKTPAKAKAPAKKKNSREAMLARVEAVRLSQRNEGHFDCFGRAGEGYCDQGECSYHSECLSVSRMLHSM